MDKIDVLLFRPDGKAMCLDLIVLLKHILQLSDIKIIKYNKNENFLYFECSKFDISFPKENNRFSISSSKEYLIYILKIIEKTYDKEELLISTPGYEKYLKLTSPEESIMQFLGI